MAFMDSQIIWDPDVALFASVEGGHDIIQSKACPTHQRLPANERLTRGRIPTEQCTQLPETSRGL